MSARYARFRVAPGFPGTARPFASAFRRPASIPCVPAAPGGFGGRLDWLSVALGCWSRRGVAPRHGRALCGRDARGRVARPRSSTAVRCRPVPLGVDATGASVPSGFRDPSRRHRRPSIRNPASRLAAARLAGSSGYSGGATRSSLPGNSRRPLRWRSSPPPRPGSSGRTPSRTP